MCKVGDIILVNEYKHENRTLSRHSFVVINDEGGEVEGIPYDLVCNVMSSFKNPQQKARKMQYDGNFPIVSTDVVTNPNNGLSGYIKSDQLYLFNKSKLDFSVIGYLKQDILELLFQYIEESDFELEVLTDNL